MTADERVATYRLEEQTADLTDAIREAVQNGIDSPGSSRVLVSISPVRSLVLADADLESAGCTECETNVRRTRHGRHRNDLEEIVGEQSVSFPPA